MNAPTAHHSDPFNTAALTLQPLLNQGRPQYSEVFRPLPTSKCVKGPKGVFQSDFKRQLSQRVSYHQQLAPTFSCALSPVFLSRWLALFTKTTEHCSFSFFMVICSLLFSSKAGISLLLSKENQLHQGSGESQEEEPRL